MRERPEFRREFRTRVARMKTRLFIERRLVEYYRRLMTQAEPLRAQLETKLAAGGSIHS